MEEKMENGLCVGLEGLYELVSILALLIGPLTFAIRVTGASCSLYIVLNIVPKKEPMSINYLRNVDCTLNPKPYTVNPKP